MQIQALQADADLSGVGEGRAHAARHGDIQVRVGLDQVQEWLTTRLANATG